MAGDLRVLVGGAEGALGQAAVKFFAEQGCSVIASCRTPADRDRVQGLWPNGVSVDVADLAAGSAVQSLFQRLGTEPRPVDVVFNAAGGFRFGPLHECSESDFQFLQAANVTSNYQLLHHGVQYWREHRVAGRFVGVSAAASLAGAAPANMAAYIASKRALNGLIEACAAESALDGITVNAVAPTIIDTPANRTAMPDADPNTWVSTPTMLKAAWDMIKQPGVNGQIKQLG